VQNEQGVYFGVKGRVCRFTQFSFFYDMCHKPWRTYFTPVPTRSNDLFLQLNQKITRRLDLLLRIRCRQGEQTGSGFLPSGQGTDLLLDRFQNHYRIGFQYRPKRWIELRNRLEIVAVSYPENRGITSALGRKEEGFLLYQDIRMDIFNRIFISLRLACFDTPSYDSRISVFENDLPGVLTNRPLYGRGIRWFVLMRCPLFRYLELSAKYSRMIRYGVSSFGSGNDRIDGNMEQQLSIQGDVRF
jgi:hypothetical protein